jgi:hypothetical protein
LGIALGVAVVLVAGRTLLAGDQSGTGAEFVTPRDGQAVTAPVHVVMRARGARLEPTDHIHAHAGHLHVLVDADCVASGLPIDMTEAGFFHVGSGAARTDLDLTKGRHRLCVELGDGAHVAFGRTQTITVVVK